MAKLSKSQLKEIVKECLVEILSEGLSSRGITQLLEPMQESAPKRSRSGSKRRMPARASSPALEKVTYTPHSVQHEEAQPHDGFDAAVNSTVDSITNDPVMSAIFADTARTTLQEQTGHDTAPGQTSLRETAAPGKDISEIDVFTDSSKNWAALAFAGDSTNEK
jgi:hypothetical protein